MPPTLQIIALIISTLGLWVALLRLPSWCFRSLHRHRLWRERDAIADAILEGRLPREHAAVRDLLRVADHMARRSHELSILDLYLWRTVGRKCDRSVTDALKVPLAGLSERERDLVLQHRDRISFLATSSMLLGSWLGIAAILHRFVPAMREVHRREIAAARTRPVFASGVEPLRATLLEATTEATRSPMGRAVREFINLQDGIAAKAANGVSMHASV